MPNELSLADWIERLALDATVDKLAEGRVRPGGHAIIAAGLRAGDQALDQPTVTSAAGESALGRGSEAAAEAAGLILEADPDADAFLFARAGELAVERSGKQPFSTTEIDLLSDAVGIPPRASSTSARP